MLHASAHVQRCCRDEHPFDIDTILVSYDTSWVSSQARSVARPERGPSSQSDCSEAAMRESSAVCLASRWPRSSEPFTVSSSMGSWPAGPLAVPGSSRSTPRTSQSASWPRISQGLPTPIPNSNAPSRSSVVDPAELERRSDHHPEVDPPRGRAGGGRSSGPARRQGGLDRWSIPTGSIMGSLSRLAYMS